MVSSDELLDKLAREVFNTFLKRNPTFATQMGRHENDDKLDDVSPEFIEDSKVLLKEAFEDRKNQGFIWNNLMLSRWVDHNGKERIVKDEFAVNEQLIDLTKQPDDIKIKIAETIATATDQAKSVGNVGVHLLKFCAKHDLVRIRDNVKFYAEPFNARLHQDQAITA